MTHTTLSEPELDAYDRAILLALQENARTPFAELARRVGLSTPSVIERVRKLEDRGVILGYRAMVDVAKMGLPVRAFVKVTVAGDKLDRFAKMTTKIPEVLECHRVTGAESFLVQVAARDMQHIQEVIDSMMPYVSTNTAMVLASPVPWRVVEAPAPAPAQRVMPRATRRTRA
ncbi:transcriptional regulator, AsnC family [Bryocella elongata]|uniref:Transcriptional regulator, AsnC family n=1 Tax=Bryocella elongata TaxID=863522 RepID=A0A1H5TRG3_9BACT|nr:Lrp/AsnC family transcriptional regulator [Bryocella elongata]SEF65340.1 transcriptional regulator, AsnC family [Bryocella elongata]